MKHEVTIKEIEKFASDEYCGSATDGSLIMDGMICLRLIYTSENGGYVYFANGEDDRSLSSHAWNWLDSGAAQNWLDENYN